MKKFLITLIFMLAFLVPTVWAYDLEALQKGFEIFELKDEFGDKTGDIRLSAIGVGEFSNTVTMGSDLSVIVFVDDKDTCYLLLLKYLDTKATFYNDELIFAVKDGTGEKTFFVVKTPSKTTTYVDCNQLIPLLQKEGILKVIIKVGTTTYNFSIDATNFNELFSKLK